MERKKTRWMILSGGTVSVFMKLWYSRGQQIISISSHNSFKKRLEKTYWGPTHLIQEFVTPFWASQQLSFLVVRVTKNLLIKLPVKAFKLLTKLLGNSAQVLIIWGAIHNYLTCMYLTTLPSLRYWLSAYLRASAYGPVRRQLRNTCSSYYWSEFL